MSLSNPSSVFYDEKGTALAVSSSQTIEPNLSGSDAQPGFLLAGSSSNGIVRFLRAADDGALHITGNLQASVTIDAVAQGAQGSSTSSWFMVLTDGTSSAALGSEQSTPLWISGVMESQGPAGTTEDPIVVSGTVTTAPCTTSTSATTLVSASATTVTLQLANTARKGLMIFNEGTKTMWVRLGVSASNTDFTTRIGPKSYWEVPFSYIGDVTALWDSAAGQTPYALITELTE
jgi:hypothetical protein